MGDDNARQQDLASIVRSVEAILKYNFRNTKLLEDALTHPSFPEEKTSYNSLEFLGDSVISLAVSNFLFLTYPTIGPGELTVLRGYNISTEKLARVAVRHGLYRFVRHRYHKIIPSIQKFVRAVTEEDEMSLQGGLIRAPKTLAGIVESIAAAIYVDCGFDLKALWLVLRDLLEPIVTLETFKELERPMTTLVDFCWAHGKKVQTKFWTVGSEHFASIYVGGELVATANSVLKISARLNAARDALRTLAQANVYGGGTCGFTSEVDERNKVVVPKQKLSDICCTEHWPKPSYRVEKEEGQSDVKKYVCSVHVEFEEAVLVMHGDERSTVEDAENSAASFMICSLLAQGHFKRKRGITPMRSPRGKVKKGVVDEIKIGTPASGDGKEDQHRETGISSEGNDEEVQHQEAGISSEGDDEEDQHQEMSEEDEVF